MSMNVRIKDEVTILSNFGRLMNDPRYVDAARDVRELLDEGGRHFILELSEVRETGPGFLGLLMTITREIRRRGGEAVLAHLSRQVETYMEEMRMDDYWDMFATVDDAKDFLCRNQRG